MIKLDAGEVLGDDLGYGRVHLLEHEQVEANPTPTEARKPGWVGAADTGADGLDEQPLQRDGEQHWQAEHERALQKRLQHTVHSVGPLHVDCGHHERDDLQRGEQLKQWLCHVARIECVCLLAYYLVGRLELWRGTAALELHEHQQQDGKLDEAEGHEPNWPVTATQDPCHRLRAQTVCHIVDAGIQARQRVRRIGAARRACCVGAEVAAKVIAVRAAGAEVACIRFGAARRTTFEAADAPVSQQPPHWNTLVNAAQRIASGVGFVLDHHIIGVVAPPPAALCAPEHPCGTVGTVVAHLARGGVAPRVLLQGALNASDGARERHLCSRRTAQAGRARGCCRKGPGCARVTDRRTGAGGVPG
eukprot:7385949-Prymnesium_polylepis.2